MAYSTHHLSLKIASSFLLFKLLNLRRVIKQKHDRIKTLFPLHRQHVNIKLHMLPMHPDMQ